MAMITFFDTLIDNMPEAGGWFTRDIADYVPVTATGVIVHVRNKSEDTDKEFGIRMFGSTDTQTGYINENSNEYFYIGLSNRKFDVYSENGSGDFEMYLIGYFEEQCVWFTDAVAIFDESALPGWRTIDVSDYVPVGTTAVVILVGEGNILPHHSSNRFGVRKVPSSYDIYGYGNFFKGAIAPLNPSLGNRQFGIYTSAEKGRYIYIVGYLTEGMFPDDPRYDHSQTSINTWIDIDASDDLDMPESNKEGILIHIVNRTIWFGGLKGGIRTDGVAEVPYGDVGSSIAPARLTDLNTIFEGQINNINIDFFVLGYLGVFTEEAAPTTDELMRGMKWFKNGIFKGFYLGLK